MSTTFRRATIVALSALALALPATAHADDLAPRQAMPDTTAVIAASPATTPAAAATMAPLGPTVAAAAVAVRARPTGEAFAAQQSRRGLGRPMALMIVGGAALVVGSVLDNPAGTLVMVGGGVMLLYGLYQYLQ